MIRRCLTLGLPLGLALLLVLGGTGLPWEARTGVFALVVVGLSIEIAHLTTERAAHYGGSGMVAGMAAMMAAMGPGLTIGYATGMVWNLGWANLVGVLAGLTHGLVMGRRYGPMAALDGAGGGVMGGLMGPMLGVMLLYLPTSLILTAILMLALQVGFSLGGVYLIAAAAGAVGTSGLLYQVGRILGAQYVSGPIDATDCCPAPAPLPQSKASKSSRQRAAKSAPPRRSWTPALIAGAAGAVAFLVLFGGAGSSSVLTRADSFTAASGPPVVAMVGPDGVQQLSMTLAYPRYEPRLMEVKAGTPVRLSLEAIGDPG
jgi:hypothetical protein